jgi:hypothetical protein
MRRTTALALAAVAFASVAQAAVTPQEAAALGTTLTPVGAETAGNASGTIPAYAGGLAPPAGFKPGEARRPDPFVAERPVRVVTASSMAGSEVQLTAGTQELLRRYPSFRVDVYPTHRTVAYPDYLLANTRRNATEARTTDGGLHIDNVLPGIPFPIPKDGREVMWNHRLHYMGRAVQFKYDGWIVDGSGQRTNASTALFRWEIPVFDPKRTAKIDEGEPLILWKLDYSGPQRRAGEALLLIDAINPLVQGRRAWVYLPGQRRVKAVEMPDDALHAGSSGAYANDDAYVYTGVLERFDVKLLGKREMLVPYSTYRLSYHEKVEDILQPGHLNPDLLRWELHRVWVVEATLKPDQRHIYSRRVFYVDEDSWAALAADDYDLDGKLRRTVFSLLTYSYDAVVPHTANHVAYDFGTGSYFLAFLPGPYAGVKYVEPLPASEWSPDAIAGAGLR